MPHHNRRRIALIVVGVILLMWAAPPLSAESRLRSCVEVSDGAGARLDVPSDHREIVPPVVRRPGP